MRKTIQLNQYYRLQATGTFRVMPSPVEFHMLQRIGQLPFISSTAPILPNKFTATNFRYNPKFQRAINQIYIHIIKLFHEIPPYPAQKSVLIILFLDSRVNWPQNTMCELSPPPFRNMNISTHDVNAKLFLLPPCHMSYNMHVFTADSVQSRQVMYDGSIQHRSFPHRAESTFALKSIWCLLLATIMISMILFRLVLSLTMTSIAICHDPMQIESNRVSSTGRAWVNGRPK